MSGVHIYHTHTPSVQKHVHIPKDIWHNHFPTAQPSTFLFSQKSTNPFCLLCSEHCLPGAVWEVENPGHRLIWPCDAGAAQRNGTALCHEDPQQAEGQCGSGFRRVFKCACHLRTLSYRTVIDNTEMSLMRKLCSQALNTVSFCRLFAVHIQLCHQVMMVPNLELNCACVFTHSNPLSYIDIYR